LPNVEHGADIQGQTLAQRRENIVKRIVFGSKGTQRGQGMVEYALILVLVSIVVIVILLTMGNQIANVFSNVVAALG
jgi:pilus assembly protein Flp/PilA